jgi:hypothetical protein
LAPAPQHWFRENVDFQSKLKQNFSLGKLAASLEQSKHEFLKGVNMKTCRPCDRAPTKQNIIEGFSRLEITSK